MSLLKPGGENHIPFRGITGVERQNLLQTAFNYVSEYGDRDEPGGNSATRQLDFYELAAITNSLAQRRDMNDIQKAFVFSVIADMKGDAHNRPVGYDNHWIDISNRGVRPSVIDSDWGRAANTANHAFVGFHESYHGFGDPTGKDDNGVSLAYRTRADAHAFIEKKERFGPYHNVGDENASKGMVDAFHAYRDAPEGRKFAAFAEVWINKITVARTTSMDAPQQGAGTAALASSGTADAAAHPAITAGIRAVDHYVADGGRAFIDADRQQAGAYVARRASEGQLHGVHRLVEGADGRIFVVDGDPRSPSTAAVALDPSQVRSTDIAHVARQLGTVSASTSFAESRSDERDATLQVASAPRLA